MSGLAPDDDATNVDAGSAEAVLGEKNGCLDDGISAVALSTKSSTLDNDDADASIIGGTDTAAASDSPPVGLLPL